MSDLTHILSSCPASCGSSTTVKTILKDLGKVISVGPLNIHIGALPCRIFLVEENWTKKLIQAFLFFRSTFSNMAHVISLVMKQIVLYLFFLFFTLLNLPWYPYWNLMQEMKMVSLFVWKSPFSFKFSHFLMVPNLNVIWGPHSFQGCPEQRCLLGTHSCMCVWSYLCLVIRLM